MTVAQAPACVFVAHPPVALLWQAPGFAFRAHPTLCVLSASPRLRFRGAPLPIALRGASPDWVAVAQPPACVAVAQSPRLGFCGATLACVANSIYKIGRGDSYARLSRLYRLFTPLCLTVKRGTTLAFTIGQIGCYPLSSFEREDLAQIIFKISDLFVFPVLARISQVVRA
jgi:hypothetical protein